MALPNPTMSFSPFAILTAEEMNNLVENDQALQDWSAYTNLSFPVALLADDSVTYAKVNKTGFKGFSSTEQIIGYLDNGTTPVYRKYLSGNISFATSGSKNLAHGIVGLTAVLQISAALSLGNNTTFQVLPHIETGQSCPYGYDNTNVTFTPTFGWGATIPYRVMMIYTK